MTDTVEAKSQTLEEKRISDLTLHLEDFLHEGEEFLVRRADGELEVDRPVTGSRLKKTHEELYGHLLAVNQQLEEAGGFLTWLVRLLILAVIVAIELRWYDEIAGVRVESLQSWWLYLLLALGGYAINSLIRDWFIHRAYARGRNELLRAMAESDLGQYRILTQIEDDDALTEVSRMLKKDHSTI